MLPYLVDLDVRPTAGTPQADGLAGAHALLCVMADSAHQAETLARAYLMRYSFVVDRVEGVAATPPERWPDLDTTEAALVRKAQAEGVALLLQAWPLQERAPDSGIEIRALPPPTDDSQDPKH